MSDPADCSPEAEPPIEPDPLLSRSTFEYPPTVAPGIPLREPNMEWVESELASMTLDEKLGQLIVSSDHANGESLIANDKVGGFIFLGNGQNAADIVATVNRLQNSSPRPLWFGIDAEAGLGARVANATIFPMMMAFSAAGDAELIEQWGRVTARECEALGIQVTYGPVIDVNTEPRNPIISTRAAGDTSALAVRNARAFIAGARAEGVLCTFKHFPGHGATAGDSHKSLPTVDLSLDELEAQHIKPYRELVVSGDIDLIMPAHVWYPQVDTGAPWPATLSAKFNKDILRKSIEYDGVLITDSFQMVALTLAVPDEGERAVICIESGVDVILHPASAAAVIAALRDAININRLTMDRIDKSVRRVLIAKSRAGLPERRTVDPVAWQGVLAHPDHQAVVRAVCEKAFACGKNNLATPPIRRTDKVLVLTLAATQKIFYRFSSTYFTSAFTADVSNATLRSVSSAPSTATISSILAQAATMDKIIVLGYDWHSISSLGQVGLINQLVAGSKPVIYVSFGAPYHYSQIPGVNAFYCGYCSVPDMQAVAVEVLLGDRQAMGVIPVKVRGLLNSVK